MKRIISIFLVLAVFAGINITAFAAETPVKSITFIPVDGDTTLVENWDGYWTYEDNLKQEGRYFCYDVSKVIYKTGNVIRVEYINGRSVDYTYGECEVYDEEWDETYTEIGYFDGDGNRLDVSYDAEQSYSHWYIDSAVNRNGGYTFRIAVGTKTVSVKSKIVESPVASLELISDGLSVKENEGGYILWDYVKGDTYARPFYNYSVNDIVLKEGNSLRVSYKDNTSEVFTVKDIGGYGWYNFVNGNGEEQNVLIQSDQQSSPWYPGGENYVVLIYYGAQLSVPVSVEPMQSRWYKDGDIWYYFENGRGVTGWRQIKNVWYYFDELGQMKTGWAKVKNVWYYMNASGAMQTGWKRISGKWYYLKPSGAMQTGWLKQNGKWYYLGTDGGMRVGWGKAGGQWYYFNSSGVMQTGWLKLSGKWYYLESNGRMITGPWRIKGKMYYFNNSGVCTNP